jgi:hypothetical protein
MAPDISRYELCGEEESGGSVRGDRADTGAAMIAAGGSTHDNRAATGAAAASEDAAHMRLGKAKETTRQRRCSGDRQHSRTRQRRCIWEERAVVTGEKATGRVVVVAALCRQAVTSRRHAVTWRRRLLASFVASVAPVPRFSEIGSGG